MSGKLVWKQTYLTLLFLTVIGDICFFFSDAQNKLLSFRSKRLNSLEHVIDTSFYTTFSEWTSVLFIDNQQLINWTFKEKKIDIEIDEWKITWKWTNSDWNKMRKIFLKHYNNLIFRPFTSCVILSPIIILEHKSVMSDAYGFFFYSVF